MNLRFPLDDVQIAFVDHKKAVEEPLFDDGQFRSNQNEFSITVEGVATYYVSNANSIEIYPFKGATKEMVELFLNNWGTVGILHQRKILNFHASAFELDGNGIMVCGDSGAGKSSLTVAFSLSEGQFLTDDLSPIIFKASKPCILTIPKKVALKEETIQQLDLGDKSALGTNPYNQKQYFDFSAHKNTEFPLGHILWINLYEGKRLKYEKLQGIEKFTMLRGEICGWEMLKGMPVTETAYMQQVVELAEKVRITKISRPKTFPLMELKKAVKDIIS